MPDLQSAAAIDRLDDLLSNADFLRGVLDEVSEGVYMADREGRIFYWNRGAEQHTGYLGQEVLSRRGYTLLQHCRPDGGLMDAEAIPLLATMADVRPRHESAYLLHKQGFRVPVEVRTTPIVRGNHECIGAIEVFRPLDSGLGALPAEDLDESLQADADTGLPRPDLARTRLREALLRARLEELPLGVLVVDFDNLRSINERFGHEAGNLALRVTGQTLTHCTRREDFVGRWKDDSFLVITFLKHRSGLDELAGHLRAMVSNSVLRWWGEDIRLKATFGLSVFDGHEELEDLTHRAEEIAAQLWNCGKEYRGGKPAE